MKSSEKIFMHAITIHSLLKRFGRFFTGPLIVFALLFGAGYAPGAEPVRATAATAAVRAKADEPVKTTGKATTKANIKTPAKAKAPAKVKASAKAKASAKTKAQSPVKTKAKAPAKAQINPSPTSKSGKTARVTSKKTGSTQASKAETAKPNTQAPAEPPQPERTNASIPTTAGAEQTGQPVGTAPLVAAPVTPPATPISSAAIAALPSAAPSPPPESATLSPATTPTPGIATPSPATNQADSAGTAITEPLSAVGSAPSATLASAVGNAAALPLSVVTPPAATPPLAMTLPPSVAALPSAAPLSVSEKAAPAPLLAAEKPENPNDQEATPAPSSDPHAKAVAWRFQGHVLLCDTDKGQTETTVAHVIHVRDSNGHGDADGSGDGSFEKPYASMDEALQAAEKGASPLLVYVWEGQYTARTNPPILRRDMIFAGSGTETPLAERRVLPAQSSRKPLWRIGDNRSSVRDYRQSVSDSSAGMGSNEQEPSGLVHMAPGHSLKVFGLMLQGENKGTALSLGERETTGNEATLEISDSVITEFGVAVFSSGPVRLLRNNLITKNRIQAIDCTAKAGEAVLLKNNNTISGNRAGIRAPGGKVELLHDNLIEDNGGFAVFAEDILLGERNTIQKNEKGLRAVNAIHLKKENKVLDNGGDGAEAVRIIVGDGNSISGNEGVGLAVTAPHNGKGTASRLELGDFNLVLDNAKDGLYCSTSGPIVLGNDNQVLRNDFSDNPGAGSGIKSQLGSIHLGNGNMVKQNGQCGILAPRGKVVMGEGNHVNTNNQEGIRAGKGVALGGENVVIDNSRASENVPDINTGPQGDIARQHSDKVGKIHTRQQ